MTIKSTDPRGGTIEQRGHAMIGTCPCGFVAVVKKGSAQRWRHAARVAVDVKLVRHTCLTPRQVEKLADIDKMIAEAVEWTNDHHRYRRLADLHRFRDQIMGEPATEINESALHAFNRFVCEQ